MTGRIRRGGGDRGAWQNTRDPQAALECPSCGLRNDPSARFCRNCGLPLGWPQDPVRGTTTRRADLPSERGTGAASVIGLIAAVAVLAVAAFLVLRPGNSGTGTLTPTGTPRASTRIASASPGSSLPGPTTGVATVPPSASLEPSLEPTEGTTAPPATFPAQADFSCDPTNLGDPTKGRWYVGHIDWRSEGSWDEVLLDMTREGDAGRAGAMTVESMTLDEVSGRIGMNPPPDADRAVVLTMDRRFSSFQLTTNDTGMAVVTNVAIGKGSDELWHVVLGVTGDGCHRAGVAAWDDDPTAQDVQLIIDVRRQ